MYQLPTAPRGIGEIIASSIQLYKKVFSKAIIISIILGVITILFGMPAILVGPKFAQQIAPNSQHVMIQHVMILVYMLIYFVVLLFITTYIQSLLLKVEGQVREYGDASLKSMALFVLRKYFIIFAAMIILFFIVLLGSVFLIIPGLFLLILLMFSFYAILFDGDGVFASIKRSAKLVWGNWWRTLVVLLIPGIVNVIIVFLFLLLVRFGFHLDVFHFWYHIIFAIPVIFLAPWGVAVGLEQYHDLKLRYQRKTES